MLFTQPITRGTDNEPVPLSFAQQRLWLLDQLEGKSPVYNAYRAWRLSGPLDVEALQRAVNRIVERHEVLRSTFPTIDGEPMQVPISSRRVPLSIVDLRGLPPPEREAESRRLVSTETRRPFDLALEPLIRAMLLQLDDDDHVLFFNLHHIVTDGWSLGVLHRELAALYEAFAAGNPSPLPDLPIQYRDYAVWQRQAMQGAELERLLAYWKRQLAGMATLQLPADRPRPAKRSYAGRCEPFAIDTELTARLKALGRIERSTLYMTLLTAVKVLLHRYAGQNDIVVGTPIANRDHQEVEPLIGMFVNTLVLRTDLSGDPNFRQLLDRVREMALAAYTHQDLPFEKLVEELQPERDANRNPLFQVAFTLRHTPHETLTLSGMRTAPFGVDLLETGNGTAKFDLTVSMVETGDHIEGMLEYSTDLFESATIQRMARHLQILLQGIVADPNRRVSQLPLLADSERHQILVDWNATKRDFPADRCIHELFEVQAERSPERAAVVSDKLQWTYGELNRRSNRLARYLRRLGVAPDIPVGVCLERSPEMVVGLLGILKAGGAYVPLDPAYPKERLAFMLKDAQTPVLLTRRSLLKEVFENGGSTVGNGDPRSSILHPRLSVVCLDADWPVIAQEQDTNLSFQAAPDNLAYIIYTSGSTGKPKGVAVPHKAVNRLVINTDYIDLRPSDVVAQAANCSFDAATFEIWGALLHGARLVLIATDVALSPESLAAQLRKENVTVLFLTTALFNEAARELPAAFSELRCLLFGGEAADPTAVGEIVHHGPPKKLLNVYGPTETTTFATRYPVKDIPEGWSGVPIGRPIANTETFILDPYLRPVPIGVAGELYVGGAGLARGYLNRPELTAEKFIPHPFSPVLSLPLRLRPEGSEVEGEATGARLYKTGDLARYLADGNIEFLARIDHQVKIRGFRIEPGEIEATLSRHPAVRETVVLARETTDEERPTTDDGRRPTDEERRALPPERSPVSRLPSSSSKRLVAYVVPDRDRTPSPSELRRFLKSTLPDYMVPSAFVFLDALPLTPNGKVNRRGLPVPDRSLSDPEDRVPPRNPLEEALADIWGQALALDRIGIYDNFFELGGHSLLATRLVSRIRSLFAVELTLRAFFEGPTVASVAAIVAKGLPDATELGEIADVLADIESLSDEETRRQLDEDV